MRITDKDGYILLNMCDKTVWRCSMQIAFTFNIINIIKYYQKHVNVINIEHTKI